MAGSRRTELAIGLGTTVATPFTKSFYLGYTSPATGNSTQIHQTEHRNDFFIKNLLCRAKRTVVNEANYRHPTGKFELRNGEKNNG
jgi:hypothetical protein